MKLVKFMSLRALHAAVSGTALSVAASLAIGLALAAPSANALAAPADSSSASAKVRKTAKTGKKAVRSPVKTAKREASGTPPVQAAEAREAARPVARKRRVSYTMEGRHRAGVRRVTFEPRAARPFGLDESNATHGLLLRSNVAYVVDQDSLEPLFDKNSQEVVPIASISKLMTAMVVLDSKAPLDQPIQVTDEDRDYEKHTGSRLSVGSVLSREDMLHIALMASENRAAAALSRYYPGGRPAFIAAMNAKAKQLGMTDTHFENSTGLTSRNVSTARDLVKMVNAAYQYPLIRKFSTDHSYEVFTGKTTLAYNSTNALVRNPSWDIGLQKTGFINEAGECLVMQTTIRARPMIVVLLDSFGKYSRTADAVRVRSWLDNGGGVEPRITSADAGGNGT